MQLVFVHGVATRLTAAYEQEVSNRNRLFKDVAFEGVPLNIRSPMWGKLVPDLRLGGAAFQTQDGDVGAFGGMGLTDDESVGVLDETFVTLAQTDEKGLVDALFAEMVDEADRTGRALDDDDIERFRAAVRLMDDADGASGGALIAAEGEEVFETLKAQIDGDNAYGILDPLRRAAGAVADRVRRAVSVATVPAVRGALNPAVARFLGDVFAYLKDGDTRKKIRAEVIAALVAADADARGKGQKLVLIGHSLGGVILYDLLSDPTALPAEFKANLLVTVGSQSALFEELGLFGYRPAQWAAGGKTPRPARVDDWIGVYDIVDVFGFRTNTVFDGATDYTFNSVAGALDAHTTYFKRPKFHGRLRQRMKDRSIL